MILIDFKLVYCVCNGIYVKCIGYEKERVVIEKWYRYIVDI